MDNCMLDRRGVTAQVNTILLHEMKVARKFPTTQLHHCRGILAFSTGRESILQNVCLSIDRYRRL